MINICKIIYKLFNYCFSLEDQNNNYYFDNYYFKKYNYPKYYPKLEIIYEK